MTDREVMQQALDALLGYKPHSLTHAKEQGSAIIALRAAIAQPEQTAPVRQPLTDEQRQKIWRDSPFRGNGGQRDWFMEGTRAAEAAHGITTPKETT